MPERMENKKSVDNLIDILLQVYNKTGAIELGQQIGGDGEASQPDKGKGKQKI